MVRRALRMGSGLEYDPPAVRQNFQPVGDVGGVLLMRLRRQFQRVYGNAAPQLGDEFILRVAFIAPLLAVEIPRKARRVLRPVRVMPTAGLCRVGSLEPGKDKYSYGAGRHDYSDSRNASSVSSS